jgi:GT2 family glycosyltransferase
MTGPFFSVVIPTYERVEALARCLDALANLDFPRSSFEVIVVDDGSTASPQVVLSKFTSVFAITLKCEPHCGPAAARNAGARRACGEYLAFTDDDCRPAPNWLSALAAQMSNAVGCAFGGATINALPENAYATASQLLISYLYRYYNADSQRSLFFASNNLAVPRELFLDLGGFDTAFPRAAAEDREFCVRWRNAGYRLEYVPDARVYHAHSLTFVSFWSQHWNYGRGAAHLRRILARRDQGRMKMEPPLFYMNLLRYPLGQVRGRAAGRIVMLLLLTQIANAGGFVRDRAWGDVP